MANSQAYPKGYRIKISAEEAKSHKEQVMKFVNSQLKAVLIDGPKERFSKEMFRVFGECVESAPVSGSSPGTRQNQRTPGRLRASGTLKLDGTVVASGSEDGSAIFSGGDPPPSSYAVIGFDTPYARVQHEQLYYAHPHGGRAKYIEGPILENVPRILQSLKGGNT